MIETLFYNFELNLELSQDKVNLKLACAVAHAIISYLF